MNSFLRTVFSLLFACFGALVAVVPSERVCAQTTADPTSNATTVTPTTNSPTSSTATYGALAVLRGTSALPGFSGVVLFSQPNGAGTLVEVSLSILSSPLNGSFAIHIHTYGDIRDPTGALALSHFNPTNTTHACYPSSSRHVGDLLANFTYTAAPNGTQTIIIQRDLIDLADTNNSIIGRAVIVHALPDNCSPPSGAAGTFIAQGVIGVYGANQRANTNLLTPPNSAVAVLFPTATYFLRSFTQPNLCLQLSVLTTTTIVSVNNSNVTVSSSTASASLSSSNCYDRRSLLFWGGATSPSTLTSVVASSLLLFQFIPSSSSSALQQYTTIVGQLLNVTDSSCFSSTLGSSGLVCANATSDQQFVLTPAMPSLSGTVQFALDASSSLMRVLVNITGLLPTDPSSSSSSSSSYQLGLHVHQYGNEYSAAGAVNGASAGGHFDPANTNHHDLPPTTPRHMGDMGYFNVSSSSGVGVVLADVSLNLLSVTATSGNILGRSVVLHVWTDNGSQPTGAAQGRIAMGVIGISSSTIAGSSTSSPTTAIPSTETPSSTSLPTSTPSTSSTPTTASPSSSSSSALSTTYMYIIIGGGGGLVLLLLLILVTWWRRRQGARAARDDRSRELELQYDRHDRYSHL